MPKNKRTTFPAFTLLELMITISVIAVLAGILTFAFTSTQKSTRDTARDTQVRILSDALEKYYRTNGEYPSVALMTSSNVDTVKTRLGITDPNIFKLPNSQTSNSITTAAPTPTQIQYVASTTDTTKNTQCQTDVDGYCDAFELRYIKESDGTLATIKSLHSTFVAVENTEPLPPINYSDDFTTSGALGNVKTGSPTVPWQFLNSTSSNWTRNSAGYASSTTAASSNPMAVADVGRADVAIIEGVRSTGNAIYFRVVDGDDWLRARVNQTQTQTWQNSGYYQTYYVIYTATSGCGDGYDSSGSYVGTYVPSNYYSTVTMPGGGTCQLLHSYSSGGVDHSEYVDTSGYVYTYNNYLIIDKSVAGTVTQLASTDVGPSVPAFIKVTAVGSTITTAYGASVSTSSAGNTVTDTTNQSITKHGIGYAASSYGSATGVKSVSFTSAP